ncbi:MAG: hypothetical protein WDN50_24980 [Bradyrhizobium sp.]
MRDQKPLQTDRIEIVIRQQRCGDSVPVASVSSEMPGFLRINALDFVDRVQVKALRLAYCSKVLSFTIDEACAMAITAP